MNGRGASALLGQLPQLFLADLPAEALVTPALVREACSAVKRNRARWLVRRTAQELVEFLAFAAERWLRPEDRFRRLAIHAGAVETGFGRETIGRGLDALFRSLSVEGLNQLLAQDLGDARRLDEFSAPTGELRTGRMALAKGAELIAHFGAGSLPNATVVAMTLGVLTKSAQFVKCPSGASIWSRLWAHCLAELEPKAGACLELAVWPGGALGLEAALLEAADLVIAHGSDPTIADIRARTPAHARFLGYGHRVSLAFVSADSLSGYLARKTAARAAEDVAAWDQHGCLSPHLVYAESGGAVSPEGFAEMLAEALAELEAAAPRGPLPVEDAAVINQFRGLHGLRGAQQEAQRQERTAVPRGAFFEPPNGATRVWASDGSTAWTVVYEDDARFRHSCLNRFIYVKACGGLDEALRHLEVTRGKVGAFALAASEGRTAELAVKLAHWGAPRICPLGRMQTPPVAWRHDGRPCLGDMVTWTDWEQ